MAAKLSALLDSASVRRSDLERELHKTFSSLRSELETREAALKQRIAQVYKGYESRLSEVESVVSKANVSDKSIVNGDPFKRYETWQRTVLPLKIRVFLTELDTADNESLAAESADRTPSLTPTREIDLLTDEDTGLDGGDGMGMAVPPPPVELLARQITDVTDSPMSADFAFDLEDTATDTMSPDDDPTVTSTVTATISGSMAAAAAVTATATAKPSTDIVSDITPTVAGSSLATSLAELAGSAEMGEMCGSVRSSGSDEAGIGGVAPPPAFIERQQTDIDEFDPASTAKAAGSVAFTDEVVTDAQSPMAADMVLPSLMLQRQITDHEMSEEERRIKNESDLPRSSFGVDINDLARKSLSKITLDD